MAAEDTPAARMSCPLRYLVVAVEVAVAIVLVSSQQVRVDKVLYVQAWNGGGGAQPRLAEAINGVVQAIASTLQQQQQQQQQVSQAQK